MKCKMWVVYAIIIHLFLLGSIFVIYFRSPVITGLQPQEAPTVVGQAPPAKRVVLIVTDGLRAESFFKNDCEDVANIRRLMLQRHGIVGISRTHVPTESRPGHIALIAGLYEDPSAVTRGWKENPIDFDTVFNRSARTFAWGANDVLHIFSRITSEQRMFIDAYDHDLDFSGSVATYKLDEWVFKKVKFFLERKTEELREQSQAIFFLHLLGLDTAGHVHKPNSALFLENLHKTDLGIYDIYEEFERIFPDGRTAFVLTSDHGMTNSGSHGAGNPHETETPFFFWGAGVKNKYLNNDGIEKTFQAANSTLPLHEIEQAQVAPFISALLGLPPPMNNFGILPKDFINASLEYTAHAAHSNALQLLHQFQTLLKDFERGSFSYYLRSFEKLNLAKMNAYNKLMETYYQLQQYEKVIEASYDIMQSSLEGIDYYHSYYKNVLLLSTTVTILGWMFYLYQLLLNKVHPHSYKEKSTTRTSQLILLVGFFLLIFVVLQKVNFTIAIYLMLPIATWWLIPLQQLQSLQIPKLNLGHICKFSVMILCIELLVLCFFKRHLISLAYLLFNFYHNYPKFISKDTKFYVWFCLVVVLSVFPLLPPSVGYKNELLISIGAILIVGRSLLIKSGTSFNIKLVSFVGILNGFLCIYLHSQLIGIPFISQIISWLFMIYSIAALFINKSDSLKYRVELIFFNLSTVYVILCTSYEPIFVLLLSSELLLSLSAAQTSPLCNIESASVNLLTSFRLALAILLYTFFSFFGTGNIASVSSFDPNIIRCFLTTFFPFAIMFLVIVKLLIPVVINISIIFGVSAAARANERQIFICLLFICDVMGLNFLYLVRNRGSWLEIGSSISHFVIMEVTTVVLLFLTLIAKMFLRLPPPKLDYLKAK